MLLYILHVAPASGVFSMLKEPSLSLLTNATVLDSIIVALLIYILSYSYLSFIFFIGLVFLHLGHSI
jgi:hypothetical protein